MKNEYLKSLEKALDELWKRYGNGWATDKEKLIGELQKAIEQEPPKREDL